MYDFLNELKRRKVFRAGLAYSVAAWLLIQITDVLVPILALPEWVPRFILLLLVIGVIPTLIAAWAYDLTPQSKIDGEQTGHANPGTLSTGRRLDFLIIGVLVLAIVFLVFDQYFLDRQTSSEVDSGDRQSIAILPFDSSSSNDQNSAFFADGIHNDLVAKLASIDDLKVVSRTSVMEYRDSRKNIRKIGEELGVGTILEGAVQRSDRKIRVNAQLINAHDDDHLWGATYDRELSASDVFAIQTDIVLSIVDALQVTLSLAEEQNLAAVPTLSLDALNAYYLGQWMIQKDDPNTIAKAVEHFELALSLDPQFSRAQQGLLTARVELMNESKVIIDDVGDYFGSEKRLTNAAFQNDRDLEYIQFPRPVNLGFEEGLGGWVFDDQCGQEFSLEESSESYSGSKSIRLSSTTADMHWCNAGQMFSARDFIGKYVQMTGRLKTEGLDGQAYFWIRVDSESGSLSLNTETDEESLSRDSDWTARSLSLYIPEDATQIWIGAALGGVGSTWIDDLSFEVIESPDGNSGF